ncbi:MAG: pyridoxal phosphate-dependent aminotransferase [Actinobacteria bacterium]|nr:pyridoxal phosphate-dependent aminotransferase [Actinomycetota bacterium]
MSEKSLEKILSEKVLKLEASPTFALDAKANELDVELKKQGDYIVRFGIGQPDFNTPENIKDAGKKAIDDNKTKYTPAAGISELKEAIVNKFKKDNGLDYEPANILAGIGAKQVLDTIMRAFVNPGDGVLIPKPYWVSYTQQVVLSDGVPLEVDFKEDLKLDKDHLKKIIADFKNPIKLIIINSPNNPTGAVYSKEELEEVAQICLENGIYIIADEVYEKFIYGDVTHHSIAGFSQDLKDITITVNAVSKTYAMTGWRIGYCAADQAIIKQMSKIQGQSPSNPCSIAQWAAIEAMEGDQGSVELMRNEYEKRRNYVYDRLKAIDGIECGLPEGAFYAFPKVSDLYNSRIKSSDDFSGQLLEEGRVAVVPGSAFGDDRYVRISYAASMDKIVEGMNRIEKFCKGL